jgi:hypothetical protein
MNPIRRKCEVNSHQQNFVGWFYFFRDGMAYIENEAGECDYYDVKLYRIKFTEKYPK